VQRDTLDAAKKRLASYYGVPEKTLQALSTGDVDILPWEIEIAYAYNLTWRPRPVLQSYSAYTPYLDRLDAAYLGSSQAPQRLLYLDQAADYRYALFDEPATFRTILSHYAFAGSGETLVQPPSASRAIVLSKHRFDASLMSSCIRNKPAG